jgi:glycosyltransferase involved in cell wall biosynthesis
MKIHYLSQSVLISDAANSVHVCRMCEALVSLGHDVTLHSLAGAGSDAAVRSYYALGDAVTIRRHRFEHPLARTMAAARSKLPGLGLGSAASTILGRFQLRPELADASPDLIYGRSIEWLWASCPSGVPFALECHAPPPHAVARRAISDLLLRPDFRGLVVISDALRQTYLSIFPALEPSRTFVAHDGADLPALSEEPRTDRQFRVGYVGQLYPGRGVELVLELARRLPEASFHLVGGNPADTARLRQQAPSNTTLYGHVPYAETARYYPTFDVVVAPYQRRVAVHGGTGDTSAFMSPLKIFEYMAWGKPILCSDHPVLREVLADGETALLLPADDVEAWESALRRLKNDLALRASLGARARGTLARLYTWKRRCARIIDWLGANPYSADVETNSTGALRPSARR